MRPLDRMLATFAALTLGLFGALKLAAIDAEVALFERIAAAAGLEGLWFMYLTGTIELAVAGALLAVHRTETTTPVLWRTAYLGGALGLIGTLGGAMATEFVVRPGEALGLVALAALLMMLGVTLLVRARSAWPPGERGWFSRRIPAAR